MERLLKEKGGTLKKLLFASLALLLLLALSRLDLQMLLESIRKIPLWVFGALVLLQIVSQLLVNLQWHRIVRHVGIKLSYGEMFHINSQGKIVEGITPGVKIGGEVTRAIQISRRAGCSTDEATAVVVIQKLFSMSAFFFVNLFAVGYLIGNAPILQVRSIQILVYSVLCLLLLSFIGVLLFPKQFKRLFQKVKLNKARKLLLTLSEQVIQLRKNKRLCIMLIVLSFTIWLLYPAKIILLMGQISPDSSFVYTYVGSIAFASYLVAMLPIFPGGIGGFEGTMSGLLVVAGYSPAISVAATAVFRFITFWLVMLFGLVFIGFCRAKEQFCVNLSGKTDSPQNVALTNSDFGEKTKNIKEEVTNEAHPEYSDNHQYVAGGERTPAVNPSGI
ncbi:MAG: flippase-like domain-containing protein [Oscillospiraceae bacterium]|nr:flippase-like domain-containing protein [Oscillospiraceae bacterium]